MNTVTIGDLHGKDVWKSIDHTRYDKVIFLGDYVDSYSHSDARIKENFLEIIQFKKEKPDKVVLLLGNHELSYLSEDFRCSGFRPALASFIQSAYEDNKSLFLMAFEEQEYLWTHAGVLEEWLQDNSRIIKKHTDRFFTQNQRLPLTSELLNAIWKDSTDYFIYNQSSYVRGGNNRCGSPVWADISEFNKNTPLKHKTQVVGHNRIPEIRKVDFAFGSTVYFIDCLDKKELSKSEEEKFLFSR